MGIGASHSWLWFVEILDRMGLYYVHFLNERDIIANVLDSMDVLLMSGGDTFAIAEGLGAGGSDRLRSFIEGGGLYIGTCAGAYLPLRSSMYPLNLFNYVNVKISNISRRLPEPEFQLLQKRFCSSYGCDLIYHAVREEVILEMVNGNKADGKKEVIAPLYGGPSMLPSDDIEPIAYYKSFTKKTKFLVREELAENTLIGNIAIAKKSKGNGRLYIFGPHFEHPHYAPCNIYLGDIICKGLNKRAPGIKKDFSENNKNPVKGRELRNLLKNLKRELSNSRIVSLGMSHLPVSWLIGNKYYQPEKISVFINLIWDKFRHFELMPDLETDRDLLFRCLEISKCITRDIRKIKSGIKEHGDATPLASRLFLNLKKLSSSFLTLYFKAKKDEFCDQHPEVKLEQG